jgi:hypothetical protein
LAKVELYEIKSLEVITGTIKNNWKNKDLIEICQIPN